jgi:hypothetical protein
MAVAFSRIARLLSAGVAARAMRDVFVAKFTALMGFAGLFIVAVTLLPSLMLPAVMAGQHSPNSSRHVPAIFVASSGAAAFVFFSLVAAQGVLLNVLPIRLFYTDSRCHTGNFADGDAVRSAPRVLDPESGAIDGSASGLDRLDSADLVSGLAPGNGRQSGTGSRPQWLR